MSTAPDRTLVRLLGMVVALAQCVEEGLVVKDGP
jgi:hypothetical protein